MQSVAERTENEDEGWAEFNSHNSPPTVYLVQSNMIMVNNYSQTVHLTL